MIFPRTSAMAFAINESYLLKLNKFEFLFDVVCFSWLSLSSLLNPFSHCGR